MKKKINPKLLLSRFYILIIFVLCIILGVIWYSTYIGKRIATVYAPLIDAAMEIKFEATTAHLWFEEIISGDRNEDIEEVWKHIDQANWYAEAIIYGGENDEGVFVPLNNDMLNAEIHDVRKKVNEFKAITYIRYITIDKAGAGTDIDEKYDSVFRDFVIQVDQVETELQQIMADEFSKYRIIENGLIFIVILITFFLVMMFIYLEKIRTKDYQSIIKANKDLESEIVDRKHAEEEAKKNKIRYRNLLDAMPLPLCVVKTNGDVVYINDNFTSTFGYNIEEISNIEKLNRKAYQDKNERKTILEKSNISDNNYIDTSEYDIICKSGEMKTMLISGMKLENSALNIFLDVTEQKKYEDNIRNANENLEELVKARTKEIDEKAHKLEKSQKALTYLLEDVNDIKKQLKISNDKLIDANKELEAFSYSVSHDLKAPLRAIIGFSRIIIEDHAHQLNDESNRYLNMIIDNAENMGTLINDLLNFSRMARTNLNKSNINLSEIAQRVKTELMIETKGRDIIIDVKDMPIVNADEKLIYHVMLNLISNSVKFTGSIKQAIVEIACVNKDNQIVYYVKDNGVGFDMKYSAKIFNVFQRLHTVDEFPGTGIGLSIVQRIIHKHGGKIWVESEQNNGTTFYFTL